MRRRILLKNTSSIDISSALVTASAQTYTGSALTPTPTVTLSGSVIPSTGYDVSYSNNINAGTASISVTGKDGYKGTASGTFTINKAAPLYNAPTKKTGLRYNGSAQQLLNPGSTSDGTFYYSYDGSNWSISIPTQTSVNTTGYTVYWKLSGDTNHTDVASTAITGITISKGIGSLQFVASSMAATKLTGLGGITVSTAKCGWERTTVKSVTGYNIYRSVSNHNVHYTVSVMKLTFINNLGYSVPDTIKIGPATESTYDFTYVASWNYSDITTYNQNPTSIIYSGKNVYTEWTDVSITIPTGTNTLQIVYQKDSSVSNEPDCGYLALPYDVNFNSILNGIVKVGDGSVSYSSNSTSVASVSSSSSGIVTINRTGSATITGTMAATTNYSGDTSTYTVSVTSNSSVTYYTIVYSSDVITYNGNSVTLNR